MDVKGCDVDVKGCDVDDKGSMSAWSPTCRKSSLLKGWLSPARRRPFAGLCSPPPPPWEAWGKHDDFDALSIHPMHISTEKRESVLVASHPFLDRTLGRLGDWDRVG